ncbi:FG-GAP-like repeat-containing protein [Cellulomonas humilata]|uniref:Fibronectin type-III domain-containing protein n=1 Tax=Cellulomonas humilata TaxID=144055 RepID=A0ABU0EDV1_9CELL|nr:FG-GAP-like repeat-containing protein [Cellulomonas humilata]MDQ0373382.1 hypothetical protein [Cellulomonas humilata]
MRRALLVLLCLLIGVGLFPAAASAAPTVPVPTGLTVVATSSGTVRLSWSPVKDAIRYDVYWGNDPAYLDVIATTTSPAWTNEGASSVLPTETLYFGVRAITRRSSSEISPLVSVVMPPAVPSGVTAEVVQPNQVRLTWGFVPEGTTFRVSELTDDRAEQPSQVLSTDDRGALVATLADSSYVFRVRAVWDGVESLVYAEVAVTTPPRWETQVAYDGKVSVLDSGPQTLEFGVYPGFSSGGGQPLGDVQLIVDGQDVGTQGIDPALNRARFDVQLVPGAHDFTVRYLGDDGYLPSESTGTIYVSDPVPDYLVETLATASVVDAAIADVTCDLRADLVTVADVTTGDGSTGRTTRVSTQPARADGSLGDTLGVNVTTVYSPTDVAVGDLTGDGCADVVVAAGDVVILTGSASGLRTPTKLKGLPTAGAVSIADLTGDSVADLLVSTTDGQLLLPGTGRGTFGKARTLLDGQFGGTVAVADLDGNALADLIELRDGVLTAYRQTTPGTFTAAWTRSTSGGYELAVADVDGDGRSDVLVSGDVTQLFSGADGSVTQPPLENGYSTHVELGDLDSDGDVDLVKVEGYGGRPQAAITTAGEPAAWQDLTTDPFTYSYGTRGVVVGDLGSDGTTEIVALDFDTTSVLRPVSG